MTACTPLADPVVPIFYSPARRWSVVAVLFLVFLGAYIDRQVTALLLPSFKSAFLLTDGQLGIIQGFAFALVYVLAALPLGRLADRANRRNLLVAGVAVWSAATIATGFAQSYMQLVSARVFVGVGEACIAPACVSLIGDYFRSDQRGRAIGLVQSGAAIGSMAAFICGGMLLQHYAGGHALTFLPADFAAWRIVLIAAGLPGLLVCVLLLVFVREPVRTGQVPGHSEGKILVYLRRRGMMFGLFVGIFGLLQFATVGAVSWGPSLLIRIYGLGPAQAGAIFGTVIISGSFLGIVCCGFLSDLMTRLRPLDGRVLILLIFMPVDIACWLVVSQTSDVTVIVIAMAISAFSASMNISGAYAMIQETVPKRISGSAIAIYLFVTNLFGLGGGPLAVAFLNDHVFENEMMLQTSMWVIVVGANLVALVMAVLLIPRYRRVRQSAQEDEIPSVAALPLAAL